MSTVNLNSFTVGTSPISNTDYIVGLRAALTPGDETKLEHLTFNTRLEDTYAILVGCFPFCRFDGTGANGSKALIVDGTGAFSLSINKTGTGAYTVTVGSPVWTGTSYIVNISATNADVQTVTYTSSTIFSFVLDADSNNITLSFVGL